MNKRLAKLLFILGLPVLALAQLNTLTTTTLSTAIPAPSGSTPPITLIKLASITGVNFPSNTNGTQGSIVYIDREAMRVLSNPAGTTLQVLRAQNGTAAVGHLSGVVAYIGNPQWFSQDPPQFPPVGTCTLSTTLTLPRLEVLSGEIFTCDSTGVWAYAGPYGGDPAVPLARTTVNDAAYTAQYWDSLIAYTALSANRVVTLPAASAVPGKIYTIVNESTGDFTITAGTNCVAAAASGGLTFVQCRSNGTAWFPF